MSRLDKLNSTLNSVNSSLETQIKGRTCSPAASESKNRNRRPQLKPFKVQNWEKGFTWLLCSPSCASLRFTRYWHTVWRGVNAKRSISQLRLSLSSPLFWPTSSMDETTRSGGGNSSTHTPAAAAHTQPSNKGHLRLLSQSLKYFYFH